jgi:hypothetical protein
MTDIGLRQSSAVLFLLTVVSCASSPSFVNFQQRYIDRPITLPTNVSSWIVPTTFVFGKDELGGTVWGMPIPFPLVWESSVGDNWSVGWSPLPVSLTRTLTYSKTGTSALQIGLHPDNSDIYGLSLAADFAYINIHKLNENFAVAGSLRVEPNFFLRPGPLAFNMSLYLHGINQVSDGLAIEYGIDPIGKYFDEQTRFLLESYKLKFYFPLELTARIQFNRQWEFLLEYQYDKFGHPGFYENHTLSAVFFHYW